MIRSTVRRRSLYRAIGGSLVTGAMLLAASSSNLELRATQEAEDGIVLVSSAVNADEAANGDWVRGRDLSGETIETQNAELAGTVVPLLETVFDSTLNAEARRTAAEGVLAAARTAATSTPELEGLQRRLTRRMSLIVAGLKATELTAVPAAPDQTLTMVRDSARRVESALGRMRNGELWKGYLHLPELTTGNPAPSVLQQVRRNLTPADSMEEAQRVFLSKPELVDLASVLDSAVVASGYESDAGSAQQEQQRLVNTLVGSLLSFEQSQLAADAEASRTAWRLLRGRYPAAAEVLRPAVNQHYFNHNLHFAVSETLLSRLVSDYRSESGCIADCIMGAWVTGSQNTDVHVRADIRPSSTTAQFDLLVNGNTRSNTRAQKSPATVWTSGNHFFWINKSVYFDGRTISSSPARFSVDTNSRTTGLATEYDGIPIIRGIVRRIASRKIAESQPQSEAITQQKLRDEALPKFEQETAAQFSEANSTLSKTMSSLDRRGVGPDSISARSSNTQIAMSSRTIGDTRLGGSLQPPSALMATGAAVQLHESLINNSIDALGFQGRTIPEKDFTRELEVALTDLFQREIKLTDRLPEVPADGEEPEPPTEFVFSKSDPIRVRFAEGQMTLVLRTGVRQEGREEIPEQIISIPISMKLEGGKVVLEPGLIGVASRVETDRIKQPTRANQIRRILSRRIKRQELSPVIDLQASGQKTLPLTVSHIELSDGWLNAEFQ